MEVLISKSKTLNILYFMCNGQLTSVRDESCIQFFKLANQRLECKGLLSRLTIIDFDGNEDLVLPWTIEKYT